MKKTSFLGKEAIIARLGYRQWNRIKYLLIALPFLVYIFAFSYVPLVGWIYAFSDFKSGRMFYDFQLIGFKHFIRLFTDRNVGRVLRNTLAMSFLGILTSPMSMFSAILLNEVRNTRVKKMIQTTTTLPNFISWVIVFGIMSNIFSQNGLLNELLAGLHLPTSQFGLIGDGDHVWIFHTCLGIWKGLGWSTILYLAAITGIDTELYDAARVDGANRIQMIRYITIPELMPTYLVLLLLSVSNLLNGGFEQYFMFWNPLVYDKIENLSYLVYKLGIGSGQYAFSVAVSMTKTLVAIILLFICNFASKKIRGNSLI